MVLVLPNPVGDGLTPTAVFRLGLNDEMGRLIVGSRRPDFPTGMEQLLVRVAVNQAVTGLQEGRHLNRQRRAAEELERSLGKERAARLEAENATNLRDEVLAVLAHDLRNPMNSILSAASLLAVTSEDGRTRKPLAVIERATRGMERLVNDLLDIARIEGGNFVMQTAPADIGELIRESVELFEPQALARSITLRVAVDDGLPLIPADKDRLLQVLSNLSVVACRGGPGPGDLQSDHRGARRNHPGRERRRPGHSDAFRDPGRIFGSDMSSSTSSNGMSDIECPDERLSFRRTNM